MAETFSGTVTVAGAGAAFSKGYDYSVDTIVAQQFTVGAGVSDKQVEIGFHVGDLAAVFICVEPSVSGETLDGAVVMETNSSSSPVHTKTFPAAGGMLFWTDKSPETAPFTSTDVTTTYWTNPGTKVAKVTVRIAANLQQ